MIFRLRKRKALFALALLAPAPSIGALAALALFPGSLLGRAIFCVGKLWLFALPLLWHRFVDREPLSLSPARRGGFGMGILTGSLISGLILAAYLALGKRFIDPVFLVAKLRAAGLGSPALYFGATAYWILVNSLLEEYVWRWFVVKQCRELLRPAPAILCAAFLFTAHHVLAMLVYLSPITTAACGFGVFLGGAVWSMMYVRYGSIWPGYVSHAVVDLCVFGIGAFLLFSGAAL